jgi:hypothetical protein
MTENETIINGLGEVGLALDVVRKRHLGGRQSRRLLS